MTVDDLIELVLEIVLDGAVELAGSRKVPMPLRVLLAVLVAAFVLAVFGIVLAVGIGSGSVAMILVSVLILIGIITHGSMKITHFRKRNE